MRPIKTIVASLGKATSTTDSPARISFSLTIELFHLSNGDYTCAFTTVSSHRRSGTRRDKKDKALLLEYRLRSAAHK
jgi:hypothetical protein